MDQFPDLFQATKIHVDVSLNRGKKIEEDVTVLRKKIVKAFKNLTQYYVEISHDFVSEFTLEDCRNCYLQIKRELEGRGFVVKGKFQDHALKMLVACINPRNMNHKWNLIFKKFLERPLHVPVSPPSRLPSPTESIYSARSAMSGSVSGIRRKKRRKKKKLVTSTSTSLSSLSKPLIIVPLSSQPTNTGSAPVYQWVNADVSPPPSTLEPPTLEPDTPEQKLDTPEQKLDTPDIPLSSSPPPPPHPITIPPLVLPTSDPESDPSTPTIMAGDDEHEEKIDWNVISKALKKSKKGTYPKR
jgi:hypothetical protein